MPFSVRILAASESIMRPFLIVFKSRCLAFSPNAIQDKPSPSYTVGIPHEESIFAAPENNVCDAS